MSLASSISVRCSQSPIMSRGYRVYLMIFDGWLGQTSNGILDGICTYHGRRMVHGRTNEARLVL